MNSRERKNAVQTARSLLEKRPVYLDTETTGTGITAEIIEIAIVDTDSSVLFDSLVKPRGAIEPDAQRVHGLTMADLQSAPSWQQTWPQVEAVLSGRVVGIYNSEFDLRMMKQSHQRSWLAWKLPEDGFFCLMKLYASFYGDWDARRGSYRWQALELARQQCDLALPNSHRAYDDALLARAIHLYMATWQER